MCARTSTCVCTCLYVGGVGEIRNLLPDNLSLRKKETKDGKWITTLHNQVFTPACSREVEKPVYLHLRLKSHHLIVNTN